MEGDTSIVKSSSYFISTDQVESLDMLEELKASIDAFITNRKNSRGIYYQCLFPARFEILKQKWPKEFGKKLKCKNFDEWFKGIDAGDVYLVFSSSYPNNPASMFGHTFFRLDRKSKGVSKKSKSILGYSVAFQAKTIDDDNAIEYTFKGLFGGYPAFLEIRPYYMNIGIYNNQESRDLWEYKLRLSSLEKKLLIYHLWEISHSVYFDYYFFDENCSTFLLKALEVVRPSIKLKSQNDIFVVPQNTVLDILKDFNDNQERFWPSIKRKMVSQLHLLSDSEKEEFGKIHNDSDLISKTSNTKVLDLVVDYWKYQNYKKKIQLSKKDKTKMFQALRHRSVLPPSNIKLNFKEYIKNKNPKLFHGFHRLAIGGNREAFLLQTRYGFSSFFDNSTGVDQSSFINFMDLKYSTISSKEGIDLTFIDILSMQKFYWELPEVSWRAKAFHESFDKENITNIFGGVGLSRSNGFLLIGTSYRNYKNTAQINPALNFGIKREISKFLIGLDLIQDLRKIEKIIPRNYEAQAKYIDNEYSYGINYFENQFSSKTYFQFEALF